MNLVAAKVSSPIFGRRSEPTHVGCYEASFMVLMRFKRKWKLPMNLKFVLLEINALRGIRASVVMTNDERMTKPQSLMNPTRSPLFRHWVIGSLIRHSSFGFGHSLARATQVHCTYACAEAKRGFP
jgi:hypothetical protein